MILAEAPASTPAAGGTERANNVLVLSAKSEKSLRQLAARYAAFMRARPRVSLSDVCFSAATGRTHFIHRLAIVATSVNEVADALEAVARGESHKAATFGRIDRKGAQAGTSQATSTTEAPSDPARAAALYMQGVNVDWSAFYPAGTRRRIPLPHYAFDRKLYWIEGRAEAAPARPTTRAMHPLLGRRVPVAADSTIYESMLSASSPAFLTDHRIGGRVLMPATGFIEMAVAAGRLHFPADAALVLDDIVFHAPLELPESEPRHVQLVLTAAAGGARSFRISAREPGSDDEWQLCASGVLRSGAQADGGHWLGDVTRLRAGGASIQHLTGARHYQSLEARGLAFGPAFRGVQDIWRDGQHAIGDIALPAGLDADAYAVHPALLDACLQVMGGFEPDSRETFVPMSIERLTIRPASERSVFSRMSLRESGGKGSLRADVSVIDASGRSIAEISGFALRRLSAADTRIDKHIYEIAWRREPCASGAESTGLTGRWLIVADRGGYADALARRIDAAGGSSLVVRDVSSVSQLAATPVFRGILHCGALDIVGAVDMSAEALMAAQTQVCVSVLTLAQALDRATQPIAERLYLLTANTQSVAEHPSSVSGVAQSVLLGFGRVLARELPALRCTRIDVDAAGEREPQFDALLAELRADSSEDELALRGADRWVPRLVRASVPQDGAKAQRTTSAVKLVATHPGVLDTLESVPTERRAPAADEVEIAVCATGLGFRDVLGALGMYPGPPQPLGIECSGVVVAVGERVKTHRVGDAVFGTAAGCFSSYATTHADCVVKKPAGLSHAAAAALPSSFLTAHYTLEVLGKLRKGQRVLIHAGAGGVGQAAVRIALEAGAEVFATAGSDAKRALLKSQGVHHVLNSRTLDFAATVRELTGGHGVDCILNSLADPFLSATFELLADDGCFLEIGKRGILDDAEAARRKPQARYYAVDLGDMGQRDPAGVRPMLETLVARLASGHFAPPALTLFPMERAAEAFRFMAQARHIGKIVVTTEAAQTADGFHVAPSSTYLITGGLGGLGLAVAGHLAARGAHTLVLIGRQSPSEATRSRIAEIERTGARVLVRQCDVSRYADVANVLAEIKRDHPPLRGVIHSAGVLDDGTLLQQNTARFEKVFAPKVAGTWNLHRLTAGLTLDWFVVFGAGAAILGERGQANYAAANSFLDSFAHWRRTLGLPAHSVDWGPWSEAGMAARPDIARAFADRGVQLLSSADGLSALERVMSLPSAQSMVLPIDWRQYLARSGSDRRPALLAEIAAPERRETTHAAQADKAPGAAQSFAGELAGAPSTMRPKLLLRFVAGQIRKAIGLEATHPIDADQPLQELGLDSLMAVELRNGITLATGCSLPATFAFDYPVPQAIADRLGEMLGARTPAAVTPLPSQPVAKREVTRSAPAAVDIASLSDDEANELLLKELEELRTGSDQP